MYKELRPFYADMIINGTEYYVIYTAETNELEIVNYEELEDRNQKDQSLGDGYFQIHESVSLKDLFQQINDYVDEYKEYLRLEKKGIV